MTVTRADEPGLDTVADAAPDDRPRSLLWIVAPGMLVGLLGALIRLSDTALWLDEAYTLGALHQLGQTLRETSGTMGAYYAALSIWTLPSESTWWMRAMSVVAAGATLAVSGRVASRLRGPEVARIATLFTAMSYLWLVYAREARSYAVVMLLTSLTWLALDHGLADAAGDVRRRWWLAHTTVATALPLFHGMGATQVLPQVALVVATCPDRRTWLRAGRGALGSLLVTGGLLSVGASKVGDWVTPLSVQLVWDTLRFLTSPIAPLAAVLIVVVLWTAARVVRDAFAATDSLDRARAAAPAVWGLAPLAVVIVISTVRPSLVPRYLIGSVPGIGLLLALAVDRIARARPDMRRVAAVGIGAALLVGYVEVHRQTTDGWTRAVDIVDEGFVGGDSVLLVDTADRPPFEAEWRDHDGDDRVVPVVGGRALGQVLRFEDADVPLDERLAEAADLDRVWVVGDPVWGRYERAVDALTGGRGTHVVVDRWADPDLGVSVVLLERR